MGKPRNTRLYNCLAYSFTWMSNGLLIVKAYFKGRQEHSTSKANDWCYSQSVNIGENPRSQEIGAKNNWSSKSWQLIPDVLATDPQCLGNWSQGTWVTEQGGIRVTIWIYKVYIGPKVSQEDEELLSQQHKQLRISNWRPQSLWFFVRTPVSQIH